ncbi:hypothetical protein PR202_ga25017 [Eleusine coracana subsp. coracana]|uniref:Uncharacterized protein n=1 Tax=Eleusine coracana subsp. coracana TaxID=191504 RepID=A0AAV5DA89_ELECO|nr:hypothetical protein PR202_ga25017 [Eleusine coracana subsp. coracana]
MFTSILHAMMDSPPGRAAAPCWAVAAPRPAHAQSPVRSCAPPRKMVHITVGFTYFLMWPLFSSDDVYAPFLAPLIIELNIVKVTVIGLGLVKDEGVVNSMTRHGDHSFMCYFHHFGFVDQSWTMVLAFGAISFVAAVVESLPISTRLDDNLTVPLASVLVGALIFHFMGFRNLCCMSSDQSNISAIVQMVFASRGGVQ